MGLIDRQTEIFKQIKWLWDTNSMHRCYGLVMANIPVDNTILGRIKLILQYQIYIDVLFSCVFYYHSCHMDLDTLMQTIGYPPDQKDTLERLLERSANPPSKLYNRCRQNFIRYIQP